MFFITDLSIEHNSKQQITRSQFLDIKAAIATIKDFANMIDYYSLIDYNVQLFLEKENIIQTREYRNFVILNGLFANWLNGYYMWKCNMQHMMGEDYKNKQQQYNEQYIEYKLAGEIRNYITHQSFAISTITYDIINERTYYYIKAEDLLADKKEMCARSKEWLKKDEHQKIDSMQLTRSFYRIFRMIEKELMEKILKKVHEKMEIITNCIPRDFRNYYNVYVQSENESIAMMVIPITLSKLSEIKSLFEQEGSTNDQL